MRNCLITFVSVVLLLGLFGCKKNPGNPETEDTARWSVINSSGFKMGSNYVNTSIVDDAGNTWIGTKGGLTKISASEDVLYTSSNSGLPGDDVRDLEFYNNNLWIGTTAGLAKYDGSKFTVYNTINSG